MFKCTVIRLQNFFNRWTGSGTFQCPQHETHVRSAWDHYRDTAFPGLTQPWSLGAGVSWTWGHLRETAAGRLTTFLTWMGRGGSPTLPEAKEERDPDLKTHLSSLTSAFGNTFSENRSGTVLPGIFFVDWT